MCLAVPLARLIFPGVLFPSFSVVENTYLGSVCVLTRGKEGIFSRASRGLEKTCSDLASKFMCERDAD